MLARLHQRFPVFFARAPHFIALMRLDRPIGIWLLLWPTLLAVFIAGDAGCRPSPTAHREAETAKAHRG